jgi:hypothetical protein
MVVAAIGGDDPMPLLVTGGQIGLWSLLLCAVAVARAMRKKDGKLWVLLRTGLALALYVPCMLGYAWLLNGDSDGPLAASMSWAAGVLGVVGMMLAHLDNPKRPVRNKLAQLMFAGSIPLALVVLALSRSSPAALWVGGGAAFTAFLVLFGDNKE